jgi:hypothetical protein
MPNQHKRTPGGNIVKSEEFCQSKWSGLNYFFSSSKKTFLLRNFSRFSCLDLIAKGEVHGFHSLGHCYTTNTHTKWNSTFFQRPDACQCIFRNAKINASGQQIMFKLLEKKVSVENSHELRFDIVSKSM